MPPKKTSIAIAPAASQPRQPRAKSTRMSATPAQVHSGTAQSRAAGPSHRAASPGTMCHPR